jgi:hypothetical protein
MEKYKTEFKLQVVNSFLGMVCISPPQHLFER